MMQAAIRRSPVSSKENIYVVTDVANGPSVWPRSRSKQFKVSRHSLQVSIASRNEIC